MINLHHYANTDALDPGLNNKPSVEAHEASLGIVFDFDDAGEVCGIDGDSNATYLLSEPALAKD